MEISFKLRSGKMCLVTKMYVFNEHGVCQQGRGLAWVTGTFKWNHGEIRKLSPTFGL